MSVCNTIQAKGRTTYNEVADELVEELRDDPTEPAGDDKNIRRRVQTPSRTSRALHAWLSIRTGPPTTSGAKPTAWAAWLTDPPPLACVRCAQRISRHATLIPCI